MEDWQKQFINKNIVHLMEHTNANKTILQALRSEELIAKIELQKLENRLEREGSLDQASDFYNCLSGRNNAYNLLIEILEENNQTAPANTLKNGRKLHEINTLLMNQLIKAAVSNPTTLETLQQRGILKRNQYTDLVNTSNERTQIKKMHDIFSDRLRPEDIGELLENLEKVINKEDGNLERAQQQPRPTPEGQLIVKTLEPVPSGSASSDSADPNFKKYFEQAIQDELEVVVELPSGGKRTNFENGWALIINVIKFAKVVNGQENISRRNGAELDGKYMRELWKNLGFNIFHENELDWEDGEYTKKDVIELVEAFRTFCNKRKPSCIVVYIGSHGKHNTIIASNYEELLLYQDVILKFYPEFKVFNQSTGTYDIDPDKGCSGLKGKPKIFLVNACQVFDEIQEDDATGPPVTDMVAFVSQAPGFGSWRSGCKGSWFTHCLTYVFMKHAKEKSLQDMIGMVQEYLQNVDASQHQTQTLLGNLVPLPYGQCPEVRYSNKMTPIFFFE